MQAIAEDDDEEEESEEYSSCVSCGGHHAPASPCGSHSSDDDVDGIVNHIMDLLR